MKYAYFYETSCGEIGIAEENGAITNVFFGNTVKPGEYELRETPALQEAAKQIMEYLDGKRTSFSIALSPEGTEFQRGVWQALLEIPYGQTRTYRDIAIRMGNEKACRAVGSANRLNPISIFIPCHRVVGANGKLTGYAGGLPMKEKLLSIERG